ncbi:MAG: xanthine dehydrogenase family protein molybdopterin-binding subunit [Alphaproteobacteria bacterium]|nr:xanthine dehydrogenase family protein molybdopterin-binding subunit [Alphaproteobacteria bacterium]
MQRGGRLEDRRFLTGAGRYMDDRSPAGALVGHVLRSPHAHAEIRRLDASAALRMPGVWAVLTHAELRQDGIGGLRCGGLVKNRDGSPCYDPPRPLLADGRARHVGDPVALIVAETGEQARDAAEAVEVDYEPLPAAADTASAIGGPTIWPAAPDNRSFEWEVGDEKATDAAFATARHVVRLRTVNNRLVIATMEPRGAIGSYDPASGVYTLASPTQGAHTIRGLLAGPVLGVPNERLVVLTDDVGGGFGMKGFAYPEQGVVLWAAKRLGRTVRWAGERGESFLSDIQARDHVSEAALALDGDGRFLALKVHTIANLGAYLSSHAPYIPTYAYSRTLTGAFRIPVAYLKVDGVFTNTVPVDAYRGAGKPEGNFQLERLVDLAARELRLDRIELRRRNMLSAADMPFKSPSGPVHDSGDYRHMLERALALADRPGFAARRVDSLARGRLRGFGLASYVHGTGGTADEQDRVTVAPTGGVLATAGTQSSGQAHETAFAHLIARELGVPAADIRIIQGDSQRIASGGGSGGSSSLIISGTTLRAASLALIETGRRQAAHLLEAATADIEFRDAHFVVAGTDRRLHLYDVAKRIALASDLPADLPRELFGEARFDASFNAFPNGCQVAEVEIDAETGSVTLQRFLSVDDAGEVILDDVVRGQIHGGAVQGIGQALLEEARYDPETGQLLSATFMDYALPRADDLPAFETVLDCPQATRRNPLGVKGVGECATIGAPATIAGAVLDALAERGVVHLDMPYTAEKIWRALRGG